MRQRVCLFILLIVCGRAQAQLAITDNQTAAALAQKITGPGITISNPVLTCPGIANGIFNVTASNLGLDSGIILTTGRALTSGNSFGANGLASANASVNNGGPGDADLVTLANNTTLNACALEFDLVPKGDTMKFDYVFGSEEYNNSACGIYNDAFAFFISGPGITGTQNIALVPGTTIPVTVNSINSGTPGSQGNIANCTSMGPGSPFTSYYVDNTGGTSITYRGLTTPLTALQAVTPCNTYHLKLVIADAGNALYDSGVFIKAGSLKTTTYTIAATGTGPSGATITKGCSPGQFTVTASQVKAVPQVLKYTIGGNAINGTDYATIADSVVIPANSSTGQVTITGLPTVPAGTTKVTLYLISPYSCNGIELVDSATINISDAPTAHITTADTSVCAGINIPVAATATPGLQYHWSPAAAFSNPTSATTTLTATATGSYIFSATDAVNGCPPVYDTLQVAVTPPPVADAGTDATVCFHGSVTLQATATPVDPSYTYSWAGPAGYAATGATQHLPHLDPANNGAYILTVTSAVCPPVQDSVQITVLPETAAPAVVTPVTICQGTGPMLSVSGTDHNWYTLPYGGDATEMMPAIPYETGRYQFYVSQVQNGCESARSRIDVTVEKCCTDNVFVPSGFSPNGDGRNDVFRITKAADTKILEFDVFNRWGQRVFNGVAASEWDGTFNGTRADMGTYSYHILLDCIGRRIELKGEITLVR